MVDEGGVEMMTKLEKIKKQIAERVSFEDGMFITMNEVMKYSYESADRERQILFDSTLKDVRKNAARKSQEKKECYLCGTKLDKYCNSHTVPKFIFDEISENGMLADGKETQVKISKHFKRPGAKNAGTFRMICSDCDAEYFNPYESKKVLSNITNNDYKLFSRIALKTTLYKLYKRKVELEMQFSFEDKDITNAQIDTNKMVFGMDLNDFIYEANLYKDIVLKEQNRIDVIYNELIDVKSHLVCQNSFPIYVGLDNRVLVDVRNYDKTYNVETIHFCVFPIGDKTRVILFKHKHHHKYKKFIPQFNELSREDKLKLINNYVYACSEDYWVNPKVFDSENFEVNKYLCRNTSNASFSILQNILDYDLVNFYEKVVF